MHGVLEKKIDELQPLYGDASLKSIYGAGCIKRPKAMLVFMNPTGKNVSARSDWKGIRAPWLGTKSLCFVRKASSRSGIK